MITTEQGTFINGKYSTAMPGYSKTRFIDKDGAVVVIDNSLLINLYELLKYEATTKNWTHILEKM